MITVADPQILWNDGFYPLVDVRDPGRVVLEAEVPGRAQRAATTASAGSSTSSAACSARPTRSCSTPPASPPRRTSCTRAPTATGDRKGEWFQLYSIGFGGIPGRPIGDGPDGHSLWPSFVNIPCEYLESYYPLRIERWETVAGHRRRRAAPRRQRRRRRLPVPGGRARSPSTTTAGSPTRGASTAASRARAAASGSSAPTARREVLPQQGPRRAGRAPATCCTSSPGAAAAGATRSPATPTWSALEVRRGLVTADGARRTAWCATRPARSTRRRPRRCGRELRRRPAGPAADLRHGPAAGDDPRALPGGDRAARPAAARSAAVTPGAGHAATTRFGRRAARARRRAPAVLAVDLIAGLLRPRPAPLCLAADDVPAPRAARVLAAARRRTACRCVHTRVRYGAGRRRRRGVLPQGPGAARSSSSATAPLGELMPPVAPRAGRDGGRQAVRQRLLRHLAGVHAARACGVDTVVIVGVSTSGCVRATAVDAIQHGFVPLVVARRRRRPGPGPARGQPVRPAGQVRRGRRRGDRPRLPRHRPEVAPMTPTTR